MKHHSQSPEETIVLGRKIAQTMKPGAVIALVGPLGAGKTQFVKGIVEGLGVTNTPVTSPTFSILQEYHDAKARCPVYHFDFYRLNSEDEAVALGLDEIFESDGISIVEWADRFPSILPSETHWWKLTLTEDPNQRVIEQLKSDAVHTIV